MLSPGVFRWVWGVGGSLRPYRGVWGPGGASEGFGGAGGERGTGRAAPPRRSGVLRGFGLVWERVREGKPQSSQNRISPNITKYFNIPA